MPGTTSNGNFTDCKNLQNISIQNISRASWYLFAGHQEKNLASFSVKKHVGFSWKFVTALPVQFCLPCSSHGLNPPGSIHRAAWRVAFELPRWILHCAWRASGCFLRLAIRRAPAIRPSPGPPSSWACGHGVLCIFPGQMTGAGWWVGGTCPRWLLAAPLGTSSLPAPPPPPSPAARVRVALACVRGLVLVWALSPRLPPGEVGEDDD